MADKNVNIKVSTTGAGKAKQQLGGLSGSISKMGKAVGIASAAYFGARGLINALSESIKLAGVQEQAEKKLSFAFGGSTKQLLNQASALQKVSTFGDEAIIAQQGFLASLQFSEEQIKSIIPVAMDLASATGMSLESAVRNTAKTFSGMAGELGELVPQIRELTTEQMKAGEAVEVMGNLFEGQATNQTQTLTGSLEQMKNAVGDASEAFGELLGPAVIKISQAIKTFAEDSVDFIEWLDGIDEDNEILEEFNKQTDNAQSVLDKYSKSLGITIDPALTLTDQLKSLRAQAKELNKDEFFKGVALSESARAGNQAAQAIIGYERALIAYKATAKDMPEKFIPPIAPEDVELLDDFLISTKEMNDMMEEAFGFTKKSKEDQIKLDLKSAALQKSSAKDAMKAVVRSEAMEAVAGYISSVFKTVPYPFNLIAAATGGAVVSGLMDKALSSFATGGDFITSGPQMIMVGDNPGGQERVRVDPISSPNINGSGNGMTINIQGGLIDESYVNNELIPALNKATSLGTKLNA